MINITQGNDCTLLAAFTRGGEAYTFDSVRKVRLLSAYGRAYALTFSGGEAGLLLALPHTMPAGRYGVEVTGTEGAAERRTMFRDMVEITAATARASRDCRAEAGCDDYDIAVSLSLVEGVSGAEATQASVARFLTARLDGTLEDGTLYSVCQPQGGASGLETGRQVSLFNGGRWLSGLDMAGLRALPVVWEDAFMRAAAEEAKKIWPTVEIAAEGGSSDGEDTDDGDSEEDEEYAELLATLKARTPYTYGDLMDMDNKGLSIMQYYYGYPYMAAATEDDDYNIFMELPMTFAVAAVPEVDGLCRNVTAVDEPGFNYWMRLAGVPMAARLKAVGEVAFRSTAIREAVLPVCASVGDSAFSNCDALSSVSLPVCASVGGYAFYSCDALEELVLGATPPSSTGDLRKGCVVYVPDDAVETYKAATAWASYTIKGWSELPEE